MSTENEVEASIGDKKIKVRGSDILTTVIGMTMAAGLTTVLLIVWDIRVQAAEVGKTTAQVLKESNAETAKALKESNKDVAAAMIRLAEEQRRATEAIKEGNCLLSIPQDRRVNAADVCKRTARDYR